MGPPMLGATWADRQGWGPGGPAVREEASSQRDWKAEEWGQPTEGRRHLRRFTWGSEVSASLPQEENVGHSR